MGPYLSINFFLSKHEFSISIAKKDVLEVPVSINTCNRAYLGFSIFFGISNVIVLTLTMLKYDLLTF